MIERKWYTVKEVSRILEVTEMTVWKYIRLGKLKGYQIIPKGKWRISAESIDGLQQPVKPQAQP